MVKIKRKDRFHPTPSINNTQIATACYHSKVFIDGGLYYHQLKQSDAVFSDFSEPETRPGSSAKGKEEGSDGS
jgi:hypothetical protein